MVSAFLSSVILVSVHAGFQAGFDLRCFDSFFYPSVRIDGEIAYRFGKLRLTVPIRYSSSSDYELDMLESGLLVSLYPFDDCGFFCAVSLLRAGYMWGLEAPTDELVFFSEAVIGWTFSFSHFFLEPRFCMLDAFNTEEEVLEALEEAVPQYSSFRLSLMTGISF